VVTGGAGFIGSHLTERLLADGHDVTVVDNFYTGRPINLAEIGNRSRLQVIEADVADAPRMRAALSVRNGCSISRRAPTSCRRSRIR